MLFDKKWLYTVVLGALMLANGSVVADEDVDYGYDEDEEGESKSGDEEEEEESEEEDYEDEDYEDEDDDDGAELAGLSGPLMLSKNTMQFGGMIGITIDANINSTRSNEVGGSFIFAPRAGWFLIDNLELLAEIGTAIPFGDDAASSVGAAATAPYRHEFFVQVGAQYIFDFDVIAFYAGALVGVDLDVAGDDVLPSVLLSAPIGILLPFNPHVALDAGTRVDFSIAVGDTTTTYIHVPIGYLGMQGFFNFIG